MERRRPGTSGSAVYWKVPNGTVFNDSMYDVDKYLRSDWNSISLAHMAEVLDLPPKSDSDDMMVLLSDDYDVTNMMIYNTRDSDLHTLVPKNMAACGRLFALAGTSRSTFWDAVAGNSGVMVYCFTASVATSMGMSIDMSTVSNADERSFKGGFWVVVIDGYSLYGSIMSRLGIYIDRYVSGKTVAKIAEKMGVATDLMPKNVVVGDVLLHNEMIFMRDTTDYMCIICGGATLLSVVLDELIKGRAEAKSRGDVTVAMGHGIISSKTCAKTATYRARYYLRPVIRSPNECGYKVMYGDTDSIFVHVKGTSEDECTTMPQTVMEKIKENFKLTVFKEAADVKRNYNSIVISNKM
ncbi:hypothetical protein MAPG_10576 [Magnaporthiopsis poae ATCC 64411]|uniref:DNA-directed DNA polymerase n=1 Tax=Magnaporthiopsis poae (strain ATCC 64411 / 73-15) TaxID=644358 RepID=A0A0C4ECY7_MAGP6|nr:hypothetical protein MAPG_10576 [Magnaporthiopsis poae ATCC 64411]